MAISCTDMVKSVATNVTSHIDRHRTHIIALQQARSQLLDLFLRRLIADSGRRGPATTTATSAIRSGVQYKVLKDSKGILDLCQRQSTDVECRVRVGVVAVVLTLLLQLFDLLWSEHVAFAGLTLRKVENKLT
jgi:hypothetical protein